MKTLLVDCETAPLTVHAWGLWDQRIGINQILDSGRTLCWAAKWLGDKKVMFDSVHMSQEIDMLKGIHGLIEECDSIIHYNGTKFDMPTLNKEFLLHGLPPPAPYKQIDLLKTARRQFRFPSNKLDYVAQALGVGSKTRHKGHDLWVGCMNGVDADWKVMEKYNKQDVVLLEKVYNRLLPWIPNHPNVSLYNNCSVASCTNCGSSDLQKRGLSHSKVATYQRYQCSACGGWSRERMADKTVDRKHLLVRDNGGA